MIDKFTEALENLNYAQSTIDDYRQTLTRSGVDLRSRRAVSAMVRGRIENDAHGEKFRAFLAYHKFLEGEALPGGRGNPKSKLTVRDACLSSKKKAHVRRIIWLSNVRGYSPTTAYAYARAFDQRADKHKNVHRARMALSDYIPVLSANKIADPVIRAHYVGLAE